MAHRHDLTADSAESDQIRLSFLLGSLKIYVLHRAAEGEVYGTALAKDLHRFGYPISPGTLYPLLHGMASSGLLATSTQVVAGRQRRYYSITRRGQSCLEETREALEPFAGQIFRAPGQRSN